MILSSSPQVSLAVHQPCSIKEPSLFSKNTSKLYILYEVALVTIRQITMSLQYAFVLASVTLKHLPFLPSAIHMKNLRLRWLNISTFSGFKICLSTIRKPIPKRNFYNIGRKQGLRIVNDITYRPASGLCLGMSLVFLAHYLSFNKGQISTKLLSSINNLQKDWDLLSIKIQAMYDSLIGVYGKCKTEEIELFSQLLEGEKIPLQYGVKKHLVYMIEDFIQNPSPSVSLREFVFSSFEKIGLDITSDIYALILELNARWDLNENAIHQKYDALNDAILLAVANCLKLESNKSMRFQGDVEDVTGQLQQLSSGSYLFQFHNHTIACVKVEDVISLFDPNEGLGVASGNNQKEALSHLLHYYGNGGLISLKVVQLHQNIVNVHTQC